MGKKFEAENMLHSTSSKKKGTSTTSNTRQIHELSKEFSSGGKRDKSQGINGSSCTSNKEGDNIYFPNLNSGYAAITGSTSRLCLYGLVDRGDTRGRRQGAYERLHIVGPPQVLITVERKDRACADTLRNLGRLRRVPPPANASWAVRSLRLCSPCPTPCRCPLRLNKPMRTVDLIHACALHHHESILILLI